MKRLVYLLSLLFISSICLAQSIPGNAIYFTESGNLELNLNVNGGPTGTVEFWVRTSADDSQALFSMGKRDAPPYSGQRASIFIGNDITYYLYNELITVTKEVDTKGFWAVGYTTENRGELFDDFWHHIAVVYLGGENPPLIYLDGILTDGTIGNQSPPSYDYGFPNPDYISIGAQFFNGNGSGYAKSIIDEYRIWNHARYHEQILSTMNDTLSSNYYSSPDSGMIAYYRFEEFEDLGVGEDGEDDIRDLTYNNYHADLVGNAEIVEGGTSTASWQVLNSGTNLWLRSLHFIDENNGWIVGQNETILYTSDGGMNWNIQHTGPTQFLSDIQMLNENIGYASGQDGIILKTTDGGSTWFYLSTGTTNNFSGGLFFLNESIGWAAGGVNGLSGLIIKTTDGGVSWIEQNIDATNWFREIYFQNENLGWVVGEEGLYFVTTDGGSTWTQYNTNTTLQLYSVQFVNENTGWIVGLGGTVGKSTNGGYFWENQNSSTNQHLFASYFIDENYGWAVGGMGYGWETLSAEIIRTTDSGVSWFHTETPTSNILYAVQFLNENVGYAAGFNGTIIKTNNGGGVPIPVELTSFTANVIDQTVELVWKTATELNNMGFEIERKTDDTWQKIGFVDGNGTTSQQTTYSYLDKISGFSSNKLYYRLKQIDYDGTYEYSNEIKVDVTQIGNFTLSQNYPNPFNPTTTIRYELPVESQITLKIFDMLGSEVATLINEQKPAGRYEVTFDAGNLASGVYIYRIQAGSFVDSKKLILMK